MEQSKNDLTFWQLLKMRGSVQQRWFIFFIVVLSLFLLNFPYISFIINNDDVVEDSFVSNDINEIRFHDASLYNKALFEQMDLSQWSDSELIEESMLMGYLDIPVIDVYLPIRYGTSVDVMDRNIGVVENTSLPVGGLNTHAVLAGHTGMASQVMLTNLTEMKEGDIFYLHVFNHDLTYVVDNISVVLPEDVNSLYIEPGEDYVTLVTCTPYGINDRRLLVRGVRSDDVSNDVSNVRVSKIQVVQKCVFVVSILFFIAYFCVCAKKTWQFAKKN